MTSKPILATLHIINSKRDYAGNCYWAFVYTDNLTGKSVSAVGDAGSNIRGLPCAMGVNEQCYVANTEMKIREFDKYVKKLPYAGCSATDMAKFIKANLEASK